MPHSIILTQEEVPLGAKVYALVPEGEGPQCFKGEPIILRAMLSGISKSEGGLIKKLYPTKSNIILKTIPENTKFYPVETYSIKNAPTNARYAVFINGKLEFPCEVARDLDPKGLDSRYYLSTEFPFKEHSDSEEGFFEKKINELLLELKLVTSPDNCLIGKLKKYKEQIGKIIVEKGLLSFELGNLKNQSNQVLETLARRHRDKPAELIKYLRKIEGNYLREVFLHPHAELVRVD